MTPLITTHAREYLWRHGVEQLTVSQAVALILGTGTHTMPITELSLLVAERLRSGKTDLAQLMQIPGLGPAKAAALVAAMALQQLVEAPGLTQVLVSPEAVYAACTDLLNLPQEHLVVFFLNIRNRLITRELVSIGTATASVLHPREIFRAAIIHNAQSILLAHNHPSGDPAPSSADYLVTKRVALAGREVGIELVDHVVCASTGWVSLRDQSPGLFP